MDHDNFGSLPLRERAARCLQQAMMGEGYAGVGPPHPFDFAD
jgi:hypothetical protein